MIAKHQKRSKKMENNHMKGRIEYDEGEIAAPKRCFIDWADLGHNSAGYSNIKITTEREKDGVYICDDDIITRAVAFIFCEADKENKSRQSFQIKVRGCNKQKSKVFVSKVYHSMGEILEVLPQILEARGYELIN